MVPGRSKRCLVAVDAPRGPLLCPVVLPEEATVAVALDEARHQLDDGTLEPPVDWEQGAVGIWGLRRARSPLFDIASDSATNDFTYAASAARRQRQGPSQRCC